MPDRQWEMEAEEGVPEGWEPDGEDIQVEADDEEGLIRAISQAANILYRLGGVIGIVARRVEDRPGIWRTTHFLFKWESYAPGARHEPKEAKDDGTAADEAPLQAVGTEG